MSDAELQALAERIKAMSPPDRLRLAADLLEQRRAKMALAVARPIVTGLEAALKLSALRKAAPEVAR